MQRDGERGLPWVRVTGITHRCGVCGFGSGKVDVVGHDLNRGAVVAVLVLIAAALQTAVNGNQRTLLEILADKLCRAVPGATSSQSA